MTHSIIPTDVTKEQSDNNNFAAEKLENNESDSNRLHTITELLLVQYVVCVTFMINRTQCALLCKFSFH